MAFYGKCNRDYETCLKNADISFLPKYINLNSGDVFSCAFACVNVGHWKINTIKVKLTMCTVQTYGSMEIQPHLFLTLALDGATDIQPVA